MADDYTVAAAPSDQPPPAIRREGMAAGMDDGLNRARISMVRTRWHQQDVSLLERDKMVEQHCRMLMGDQWSIWSPLAGVFVNIAEALGLPELLWRELPRVNKVADWYDYTIARLTENPPVLRAVPRDADRLSALLAEASDVLLPKLWDDLGMTDRVFEIVGWMAAAGWAFVKTYADFTEQAPGASASGQPASGRLVTRVLGPLDVRGEWGMATPWQEKKWHIHRLILNRKEVEDRYQMDVPADTTIQGGSATQYYRLRLERGPGHYGATDLSAYGWGNSGVGPPESLVTVDEMWERPSPMFPEGRLTIVTANAVLHDSVRPFPRLADYGHTSPITYIEWQRVPGRPYGTTPLERGVPLQRQINLGARQFLLHRAKTTNPVLVLNAAAGLTEEDAEQFSRPGSSISMEFPPGTTQPPAYYLAPGALGEDAWKVQQWLEQQFNGIMDLEGSAGTPQTGNASGEQVKELRFNSDRPISVPVRHLARGLEQIGCLWYVMLPMLWPEEQAVAYVGTDESARTRTFAPEMWDGKVKVEINAESMMPRSRQEREAMAFRNFQAGLFGLPGSPESVERYYRAARFSDLDDEDLPAGVDAVTGKHLINSVSQGVPAGAVPMLEQWNYPVLLAVLREFMASPEFLQIQPPVQQQLQALWVRLQDGQQQQMVMQMIRQSQAQGKQMQIAAPVLSAHAALSKHVQETATPEPPPDAKSAPQPA